MIEWPEASPLMYRCNKALCLLAKMPSGIGVVYCEKWRIWPDIQAPTSGILGGMYVADTLQRKHTGYRSCSVAILDTISFQSLKLSMPWKNMVTSSNGNTFRVTGHLCEEFTGEFSAQRPVTRSCDVFFDLRLNKRLSKQSWGWWVETPSRSLWHHCNENNQT